MYRVAPCEPPVSSPVQVHVSRLDPRRKVLPDSTFCRVVRLAVAFLGCSLRCGFFGLFAWPCSVGPLSCLCFVGLFAWLCKDENTTVHAAHCSHLRVWKDTLPVASALSEACTGGVCSVKSPERPRCLCWAVCPEALIIGVVGTGNVHGLLGHSSPQARGPAPQHSCLDHLVRHRCLGFSVAQGPACCVHTALHPRTWVACYRIHTSSARSPHAVTFRNESCLLAHPVTTIMRWLAAT